MTYSEAFPLWVAEVYHNHGYEPGKWYGSEVAETLYNEAMATYNGPPATMWDYIEAIPSADEFAYLDYAIERLHRDNINLNALSDKERWALMDKIVAEYPQYKNVRTSRAKQVQQTSMQAALDAERDVLLQAARRNASRYSEAEIPNTSRMKLGALMSPVSGSIWMTEQCFLSASPPASGVFSSSRKVPRRTGTRSVRKRVRTTTAMSFTPKLMLFGMKLHRRETEGR